MSQYIAEQVAVAHESPQVVFLYRGRVEMVLNHEAIRAASLSAGVKGMLKLL